MKERLQRNFAGETTSYETQHDGRVYWTQQAPLLDPIGQAIVVTIDITDQKQAEAALRESKERYRDLFDLVPVAVYTCDADGLIQEYNQRAVELWGREPEKHDPNEKYCGSFKIFYPDGRFMPHGECPMARILGGETLPPHELEILVERPDGGRRNVIAHPLPLKNERGEIMGAINCLYDITERKQAEEKLRESENLVRSTLDSLTSSVAIIDRNGVILDVNDAWIQFAKANGYNRPHFGIGENYLDVVRQAVASGEQSAQLIVDGIETVLDETEPKYEVEYPCHSPDEQRWFILNVSPLAIAQGGAVVSHTSITARKQAEEALQQSNLQLESRVQKRTATIQAINQSLREEIAERKRAEGQLLYQARLIANVNDAIVATDENLAIGYWNQAAEQIYGWKAEEVMGRRVSDVLQSEFVDGNTRAGALQKVNDAGELRTAVTQSRKDGTRIFVEARTSTLRNEEGKTVGYISINRDVTERTQMDEALRRSRERLQVLSQRLVEVQEEERRAIARELHDRVGQTLAALNINLIIMNDQLLEDSKQRIGSRLDDSMQLVAEAIALVRDVMTDLRPAVLDDYGLEAALESYVEQYKSRYEIEVVLEPPDQPIPRLGLSLEMTLLRIAQEALFNIARHAKADLVNVSLRLQDSAVHLLVQDNGVGIVSSQGTNRPGSHGLKIMRERAEAFGGRVDVSSVPGEGTKIEARIPIGDGGQNQVQRET
jgi:PAS domain S-box-containing protein